VTGVGVNFGHLACGTASDIFCDEGFHVWPLVVGGDELECFGDSRVSRGLMVMKKGDYSPPKHIVCHDNQYGPVMPSFFMFWV